jgi:hypothetical protein
MLGSLEASSAWAGSARPLTSPANANATIDRLIRVLISVLPYFLVFHPPEPLMRSVGPGRKIAREPLKNLYRPAETL